MVSYIASPSVSTQRSPYINSSNLLESVDRSEIGHSDDTLIPNQAFKGGWLSAVGNEDSESLMFGKWTWYCLKRGDS